MDEDRSKDGERAGAMPASHDGLTPQEAELLQRARARFDAAAQSLDADTQRRLTRARQAALAELASPRPQAFARWAPVGAAAAVAVVAVGVALSLRAPPGVVAPDPLPMSAPDAAQGAPPGADGVGPATEMELLLGDDDPALYDEDPEFYDWAAAEAGIDDAG